MAQVARTDSVCVPSRLSGAYGVRDAEAPGGAGDGDWVDVDDVTDGDGLGLGETGDGDALDVDGSGVGEALARRDVWDGLGKMTLGVGEGLAAGEDVPATVGTGRTWK
jgi:hypothetical protein